MTGPSPSADSADTPACWRHLCQVPEDWVVIGGAEIVECFNSQGERTYLVRYSSETPVSTTVGLLTMAAQHVARQAC